MDDPAAIERGAPGRRIEGVERYGKFLLLRLSPMHGAANGNAARASLLVHLGMTGRLAPSPSALPCEKHTHACFALDDGRELRYTDARRFGRMAFFEEGPLREQLRPLGADPLDVSEEEFAQRIRTRRARIKALLLDQHVLRGVGNIYADESLWRAKNYPAPAGAQHTQPQTERPRPAVRGNPETADPPRRSPLFDFVEAGREPGGRQRPRPA